MDDEYFGRIADESAEGADPYEGGAGDPQPLEPTPTDIVPDPTTAYLTLAAIEQHTGIKYMSLLRYAQQFGDRLPHEGTGRNRRYYPSAIAEFQRIKVEMSERRGVRVERPDADTDVGERQDTGVMKPVPARSRRGKKPSGKGRGKGKGGKPASKRPAILPKPPKPVAAPHAPWPSKPSAPVAASVAAAPPSDAALDLDRLSRIYQLRLQLKTLDEVAAFVAGWRTRVETEIKELEGAASR